MTIFNLDTDTLNHYAKSPFKRHLNNGIRVENKDNEATIYLYDEISYWGISADAFVKELSNIDAKTIHLRINSPGGSVFDGTAIYNALKQHSAKVIVHVDGLAASIASVIAMAGDEVIMGDGAYFMGHQPWSIAMGTADDFRKEAGLLDKVGGTINQIYRDRTGKSEEEIKTLMDEETWMTAQEAVDYGFADSVDKGGKDKKKNVANLFDLSVFNHVPDELKGKKELNIRDMEQALRDVGCSNKQAKAILAKGYSDDLRDEEPPETPPVEDPPRDVVEAKPKSNDRVNDLLIRAEMMAPKQP